MNILIHFQKSSCIGKCNRFSFKVNKNKIADYFLCIAFDNRKNLNVKHIWLLKGDIIIYEINPTRKKSNDKTKLNDIFTFSFYNRENVINKLKKYELIDKLDKIKELCRIFIEEDNSIYDTEGI